MPEQKQRDWLTITRIIVFIVALLLIAAGGIIWILHPTAQVPLFTAIFTPLGVIVGLFQLVPFLKSSKGTVPPMVQVPSAPGQPLQIINTINIPPSLQPPPPPIEIPTAYRGIASLPPPTDPHTILQREKVVKDMYTKLVQPNISSLVLTGIGGIGKSTLAALVYNYAERQRIAGKGPFRREALWLRVDENTTFLDLANNLFTVLGTQIPDFERPGPQNQALVLFNQLNIVNPPLLIVLDQFENLFNWETGKALVQGTGEFIDALNSKPCSARILFTTQLRPRGIHVYGQSCLRFYSVSGLDIAEGQQLLRSRGIVGTEADLQAAIERCGGHSLSLVLLTLLLKEMELNLSTLLKSYTHLWDGDVAINLLDLYMKRLNEVQCKLLQTFSIYREAASVEAVQLLMDESVKEQTVPALRELLAMHLVQAVEEGKYQLHPIVTTYTQNRNEQVDKVMQKTAHYKAAQYYLKQVSKTCPERSNRRNLRDVQPFIEAVWQLCQAEQWEEAYDVMLREHLFADLRRWGGNALLRELCQYLLSGNWQLKPSQAALVYSNIAFTYEIPKQKREVLEYYQQALRISKEAGDRGGEGRMLNNIGSVYDTLGQKQEALKYYQEALDLNREVGDRVSEGRTLNNIGSVYDTLGQKEEALKYYQRALLIRRKIVDRIEEGTTLNNLGGVYNALGQKQEALTYYKQALAICREVGNRGGEGTTLNNLGLVYDDLGQKQEALTYYKQALAICREVGNRGGEGAMLWNIGAFYFEQERYDVALAGFVLAKRIFLEVQSPSSDVVQRWIDALHRKVDDKQFAALLAHVEPQARQIVDKALSEL